MNYFYFLMWSISMFLLMKHFFCFKLLKIEYHEFTSCSKYLNMSFLNTISVGFLVALFTHIMDLFVALKREFLTLTLWFGNFSQTKPVNPLSVPAHKYQMKTYCERRKKICQCTFKEEEKKLFFIYTSFVWHVLGIYTKLLQKSTIYTYLYGQLNN